MGGFSISRVPKNGLARTKYVSKEESSEECNIAGLEDEIKPRPRAVSPAKNCKR